MTLLKILSGVFFGVFTLVFLLQAVAYSLQDIDFMAFWALVPVPFQAPLAFAGLSVLLGLVSAGIDYLLENLQWFD